ncbi:bacillithiol biosynthesis cysteine-adding enzyme BshC [Ulvibacter sp. MAR_2010_11]|uniref:bacillithiol biosynthesis cysteine-adding enzyme BshC n=1 Tax=Ulvibacter sp. MAR_2010_11 TaxID=1250229 RepID=UPI000C2C87E8|nr:bacillithiol biosynthesis cysteine-adding enzyme BshC [Ulvibacter sp. MAR_2010_11]PKA83714.1 bacillithiol biosynthesis cysteine-adding enzyme BshC [Ulvibacter sp. MAR_2010_11]
MSVQTIPYSETGYFSNLICDYLAEKKELQPFYHRFPKLDNFMEQLQEKQKSFPQEQRNVLVERLKFQNREIEISEATQKNIAALSSSNTFTITTGHQLNLFTGPLYFLYKIISVINLSETLNKKHPKQHFVPIYWMATEDHDFDEINYFNLFGKKIKWNRKSSGAVGELSTEGLAEVAEVFKNTLGNSSNAKKLISLFTEAYVKHHNLADATRYLANVLFSEFGLVIIDGNDTTLKKVFIPFAEKELTENLSFKNVTQTTKELTQLGYNEQVHPREINLFYLKEGLRERIIEQGGRYYVNETDSSFSKEEIIAELNTHPERFSPNALLRPLYQEVNLPNLCYVGGGGELAYWFQLKDYFKSVAIPFPILLLRNSVLLLPENLSEKLKKLDVNIEALFLEQHELESAHTKKISEIKIDFSTELDFLEAHFRNLKLIALQTDKSFEGAVNAQEKKQINGLKNLEKRLLKAQKRKLSDQLNRLTAIQDELFPKQSLQERSLNFSEFYEPYGENLIKTLKENLNPLSNGFTVVRI